MISKIKTLILSHKIISGLIVAGVAFGSYAIFKKDADAETRYVTAEAKKGSIVSVIDGTGQVEAESTIELSSRSSGTITHIAVSAGQAVKKGALLFRVDDRDIQKSIRDAQLNLQSANSDLENAKRDYETTKASQELSLKNTAISINSEVVAVPDDSNVNTSIVSISGSYDSTEKGRYTIEAYACQKSMCATYSGLESGSFLINENIPKNLGNKGFYITFSKDPNIGEKWHIDVPSPTSSSYLANMRSYEEKENSFKETLVSLDQSIKSRELSVVQRQNALDDLRQSLSDYYITAPFDGTIAKITAKVGESASASLGTIITNKKLASVSLNEVDVAKVRLGQKATLSFDAIDDLSMEGTIASIDSVGTVSSGVVSYAVKIDFDKDDERIKPGMTVSSTITIERKDDVLTVPSSAIKRGPNGNYVEAFASPLESEGMGARAQGSTSKIPPERIPVTIGLSDESSTEIVSGLNAGDQVVSRTITSSSTAARTNTPSILGNTGARGGGNFTRMAR